MSPLPFFKYLWALIKNPVKEIQNLPEMSWKNLLIFQFCLSSLSVVISNLLAPFAISILHILLSVFMAMTATALASLFFYYFFLIIYNQQFHFIKIFTLVLFAHIPFAVFHLGAYFFPPSDLIGIAISGLLMIVGLVENFRVPRRLATRLMIGLYLIFVVYWVINLIYISTRPSHVAPKDLDVIEKEVNQFFDK